MLQRLLDKLDEAANYLVRIMYLLSGVTAVAVYFGSGGNLPPFIDGPANAILPWALAFAVETQAYISSRRLSKAYNTLQAPALEDYQKEQAKREIKTQLAILVALLSFSIWNQFNYLGQVWHPTSVTGAPIWVDYLIRAVAVPVFFLAGSFLAPQAKTIGEQMDEEAHKTLRQFLRMMSLQRKQAIRRLSGRRGPLTRILQLVFPNRYPVPPMIDMSDAIQVVAEAAHEKKAGQLIASIQGALVQLSEGATVKQAEQVVMSEVRAGTVHETPKQRARRAWKEGMKPQTLAKLAGVSDRQARRYIADFRKELAKDTNVRLLAVK